MPETPRSWTKHLLELVLGIAVLALIGQLGLGSLRAGLESLELGSWSRTQWITLNALALVVLISIRLTPALRKLVTKAPSDSRPDPHEEAR